MMYKSLVLSAALLSSTVAHSNYTQSGNTLTFDDQWWQVENPWPANGIVCSGNSGDDCTLSPGNYKWVGSTGSGHFTINATSSAAAPELIYQPAIVQNVPSGIGLQTFQVPCPSHATPIGGSCKARARVDSLTSGLTYRLEVETSFDANGLSCTLLDSEHNSGTRQPAFIEIMAVCQAGSAETLPQLNLTEAF